MTAQIIRPKNWGRFQHYTNRSPIWIKLHRSLLDDYDFQCLPIASKALAPMLWLVASEHENGDIPGDLGKVAFRLRMSHDEFLGALQPLLSAGFFEIIPDDAAVASATLADCDQDAFPLEKRTTTREEEKKARAGARDASPPEMVLENGHAKDFEVWWNAYPVQKCREDAEKSYLKALSRASPEVLLAAAKRYAGESKKLGAAYPKYPQNWLDQSRWLDSTGPPNGAEKLDAATAAALADKADRLLKRGKYAEH